jgi:protein subunit release factor B
VINFPISEEKLKWLIEKMNSLGIKEEDIEEKFVRSSGKGGQKVNKTSSCVYLRHIPTGIEVKCMKERSQSLNRFFARRELIKKIERLYGLKSKEDIKRERIKKQKDKRKRRAKIKYSIEADSG